MKKFIFAAIVAILATGSTFAQYKPTDGSVSLEVQFNPFDQNGKTFSIDGVKVRYFFNEENALRFRLGLNGKSDKYEVEAKEKGEEDRTVTSKSTTLKIDLGYERHFNVSKRIDLYVGGLLGINKRFASTKEKVGKEERTLSNAYLSEGSISNISKIGKDDRAYFGFNIAAITGIDFYVYKGLYLGAELGFNVDTRKTNTVKYEDEKTKNELNDSYRTTSYGFYIEPVLRLGWTF